MKRERVDILKIAEENNNFIGSVMDEAKSDQLHLLQINAQKIKKTIQRPFWCDVLFEKEDNSHRHCMVIVDISTPISFTSDKVRSTIAEMIVGSDDFSINIKRDGSGIRMAFTVFDLWKK